MNQEETEHLNRPIITNEIDAAITKLPANKSPGPDGFTGDFYLSFKEEHLSSKYFKKFKTMEGFQSFFFYKASSILIPKPGKLWYIYTMEFYAAERKTELLPFATAWMELESIMLSEISQVVKDKYHMISPLPGT